MSRLVRAVLGARRSAAQVIGELAIGEQLFRTRELGAQEFGVHIIIRSSLRPTAPLRVGRKPFPVKGMRFPRE